MAKTLRAGMIGCGAIADRLHVPDYVHCAEGDVVAMCDIVPEHAREVADHWGVDATFYTDWRRMLAEAELDAVTVALPNALHCEATVDALEAGCHVLCEKPMAASIDECKRMIAAAEKAGKLLMVNQAQRLVPAHLKAREVMASGILGRIFHVTAVFGHSGPDNWHPPAKWFFDKKQARFGAMADLGVHKADLVRYLTGLEVAEVGAFMAQLHKHGDVEDNFVACLHFESGAVGTLASSWTIYGHDANFVHIHCEKGTLKVGTYRDRPVVAGLTDPACEITFDPPPSPNDYPGTWQMDASGHFLRACMGVEEPFCTGEEGMRSLAILTAAEKAAQSGQMQKVQV